LVLKHRHHESKINQDIVLGTCPNFCKRNSAAANHNMEHFQKWNGRVNLAKKEDVGLQLYLRRVSREWMQDERTR